jgi:FMN phosphatase YigB (HAD superfamily)
MWPKLSPSDLTLCQPFQSATDDHQNSLRVIFFDIGSVLIDLDWDSFFARQHELNPEIKNFSVERMMTHTRESQLMVKWCTGRSGPFDYVRGMLEAAGHAAEQAHALALGTERLSNGAFAPALVKELSSLIVGPARPRVVRLIQNLRRRGFIVGALSNATPWHESDILRTTSLHELFDVVLFSQDLGTEKPDPRFYMAAQQAAHRIFTSRFRSKSDTELRSSQFAFVDDTPVNVHAALNLGWQARLVCLLKDSILSRARDMSEGELSAASVRSENLVFADEAARRVEGLFSHLIQSNAEIRTRN